MRPTFLRYLAASTLLVSLAVLPTGSEAQSQASKTGLGVSRQSAGATSGQSTAAASGTLSVGAIAAAVGLVVVIGIAVAVGSGDGAR